MHQIEIILFNLREFHSGYSLKYTEDKIIALSI